MKFINEFHEQTSVLKLQVFHPQAAIFFACLNIFPCDKALGTVAHLIASLEESTTTPVDSFDDCFRSLNCRHEMEGNGAKDSSGEGEAPGLVKERGTPAREVFVTGGDQGEVVSH